MPDGDNSELTAQIDQLRTELASKEEELAKYKNMHEANQEEINKRGNVIGETKKKLEALEEKINAIADSKISATPEGEGKKTAEEIAKEEQRKHAEAVKGELSRLQGLLTDEDDTKLNEAYDSADPEVQAAIDNDPAVRKKFLEKYLGERAVPKRSWRGTTEQGTENRSGDILKKMETMFDRNKEKSNFSPVGSSGKYVPDGRGAPEVKERTSENLSVLGVRSGGGVPQGVVQGSVA